MTRLTRRRRLLLLTAAGGAGFLVAASIAAVRWQRGGPTYRPGEEVEGITSELERALPPDHPRVTFTDVTRAAGIGYRHFSGKRASWLPEDMGSGAAWGDFDGDGWLDLAVANEVGPIDMSAEERAHSPARAVLYRNNHDDTFTDVTDRAHLDFRGWGMAVAWADYDNDGHPDLLITAYGHNVLYHNDGDGTFTDVSAPSSVGAPEGFWAGAAWGDYDRDGRLDLYVTGYVNFSRKSKTEGVKGTYDVENPASINPLAFPGERNLLFHNDGNGHFTERAAAAGVENRAGRGLAAAWVDVDEDGWPDLYVANDVSQNALYRNLGNGKFQNIGETARVSDYRSSMGIAVGDWNGDGTQDLFLTHWLAQGNALYDNVPRQRTSRPRDPHAPPVAFMDEADRYGLGQISYDFTGWATSFVDYDDDGKLDLFVVNGSTLQSASDPSALVPMQSRIFWNRGTADGFFDVSPASGAYFQHAYVGRGAAFADYDNDGDVDVFVVNHGGPGVLLRNDGGNRNHWLRVALRGARSNRDGIGAKVRVVAGGLSQKRQVGAQAPYLSQNALAETFGLGQQARADTIEVVWPSGVRDLRTGVAANQQVLIVEGSRDERGAPGTATATTATAPAAKPAPVLDRERVRQFWAVYREASAERIAHRMPEAAAGYARALALNPDHEDALYYAGSVRLELGDYDGALRAWRHLLAVNPGSARTHSQLGALYACPDPRAPFQLDSAEAHLQRAHLLNREENGPILRLGEVALVRGDLATARRQLASVLATDVSNATAHYYAGYLAFRAHDEALARAELRKAAPPPPATAHAPAGGVPGEGDTHKGAAPLTHAAAPCDQLRATARSTRALDAKADVGSRYRELERVLASARRRVR